MSWDFYLVAVFVVSLTGMSKSGFAGGLGVLAVPLLSLYVDPAMALAIQMPLLIGFDLANIWYYRRDWRWRVIQMLLPGAMLGIVLGAMSFHALPPAALKLLIGGLALIFAAQVLLARPIPAAGSRGAGWMLGLLSGFAGFVAHAGGPPIKAFLLAKPLSKSEFVGTNGVFFAGMNLLKAAGYGVVGGFYSWEAARISLSLTPCLLIGLGLGYWLHARISQRTFTRIAHGLLAVAGAKLIWDGLGIA